MVWRQPDPRRSTWPSQTTSRRTTDPLLAMPLDEGVPRPCELTTSFGNADLAELFSSGRDTLVTDFDVLDLSKSFERH